MDILCLDPQPDWGLGVLFLAHLSCIPIVPGLVLLWKKDKAYLLYTLAMVIVPVTTARYASFTRYAVLAFPLFFVYGEMLAKPDRQLYKWVVVCFLFGVQILLTLRYVNNYWAG